MNFLKTSMLSAISAVIKLLSGVVINKIIAVYIGPSGIALIGQFQNLFGIVTTIGNGAINSGVTKYVAEYNEKDQKKRDAIISASLNITFLVSLFIGAILFFASSLISDWILKTTEYHMVFKVFGITLVLIGTNTVILSIINGLKQIKLFIFVNITGSLLSLIITSILTIKFNLWGALISLVLVQGLLIFISLPIAVKKLKIRFTLDFTISKEFYRRLFAFSLMSITAILSSSISQISIRNHLIEEFSMQEAGYWQSVWMISSMYLMVLTTALTTYFLPRMSELTNTFDLRKEIFSGYKIIVPFVLVTATSIYFMRDIIIQLLFTKEFYPMRELFFYQLTGDFLKMCSWVLAYLMVAKGMTKAYIITEIIFAATFYISVLVFTKYFGLIGVTQAYALNYFLYLLVVAYMFRDIFKIRFPTNTA